MGILQDNVPPPAGVPQPAAPVTGNQTQDQAGDNSSPADETAVPGEQEGGESTLGFPLLDVRSKVPPEMQRQFDQLLTACKRVMYDPKTHDMLVKDLSRSAPMEQKLAESAAGIVKLLASKASGKFSQGVVVAVGVDLVGEEAEFMAEGSGEMVDKETYMKAVMMTAQILAKQMGMKMPGQPQAGAPPQETPQGVQPPQGAPQGPPGVIAQQGA